MSASAQIQHIQQRLQSLADPAVAGHSKRFFKTGPGEYGEGDLFRGIRVPVLRDLAKKLRTTTLEDATSLLDSEFHEDRLLALLLLVDHFKKGDEAFRKRIYTLYLKKTERVNNWDLVDTSAEHIVGAYLFGRERTPLYRLINSRSLWERRIGIMSTFYFIKKKQFDDTLALAEMLINDQEDLMHKAVGWMLREIGNRTLQVEEDFLRHHYKSMPRTMLRYAIEKFPEKKRQAYLKGLI